MTNVPHIHADGFRNMSHSQGIVLSIVSAIPSPNKEEDDSIGDMEEVAFIHCTPTLAWQLVKSWSSILAHDWSFNQEIDQGLYNDANHKALTDFVSAVTEETPP